MLESILHQLGARLDAKVSHGRAFVKGLQENARHVLLRVSLTIVKAGQANTIWRLPAACCYCRCNDRDFFLKLSG
jgi:hypothetical protein